MGQAEQVHAWISHTTAPDGFLFDAPAMISFRFPGNRYGNLEIVYSRDLLIEGESSVRRSSGITALGRADAASIAKLDNIAEVALGIEVVVLILVDTAALDYRIATPGIVADGLLHVRIE